MYEILRLRATDMSDEGKAKEYCLEVKKRLFGPYRVRFLSPRVLELFRDKCVNLSHVDVKQQSAAQSQCNIKAVIERSS